MCSRDLRRGGRDSPRARAMPESPPLYAYVLDADDDLAEELDIRTRVAARQLATARVLDAAAGECDLGPWFRAVGHGPGLLILDGLLAVDTRIGDRTVDRARRVGRPAPADGAPRPTSCSSAPRRGGRCVRRGSRCSTRSSRERVLPWPQIAQALLRRAERRTDDLDVAAGDLLPAAARGAADAAALAPRRPLGPRRAGRHPPVAAAHAPPARPARRRPSGRRSRTRSPGWRSAGLVTGAPGTGTSTASSTSTSSSLIERTARPDASIARRTTQSRSATDAHEHCRSPSSGSPSGLGCDGDSIAMTAATNPSLEDLLRGSLPGDAADHPLQPGARVRDRRRVHARVVRRRGGQARPVHPRAGGLGAERGDQRRRALGRDGRRPRDRAADPHQHLDRPPRAAGRGRARARHVRRLRRDPGDAEQPDRRDGPRATTWAPAGRRGSASRSSTCPAARSSPTTSPRRCSAWCCTWRGIGPPIELDAQGRPVGIFGRTVHESCNRAGFAEQGEFSKQPRRRRCLVKLGCSGPVVKLQRADPGLGERGRRLPERRRHLHGLHDARASPTSSCRSWSPTAGARIYARTARFAHGPLVKALRERKMRRTFDVEPRVAAPGEGAHERVQAVAAALVPAPPPGAHPEEDGAAGRRPLASA